jgi:DNA polymerase III epsilon subunit-like protein
VVHDCFVLSRQMPQSFARVCTMQLARKKRVAGNARLSIVASSLRIPTIANAHRAMVDAAITAKVLSLLHDEYPSTTHSPLAGRVMVSHPDLLENFPGKPRKFRCSPWLTLA